MEADAPKQAKLSFGRQSPKDERYAPRESLDHLILAQTLTYEMQDGSLTLKA